MEQDAKFARTLEGIKAAGLLACDRKAAVRRATELSMGEGVSGAGPCADQESLLYKAGRSVGLDGKIAVPKLKAMLRERGSKQLASRVGKETTGRNASAHPLLVEEVL